MAAAAARRLSRTSHRWVMNLLCAGVLVAANPVLAESTQIITHHRQAKALDRDFLRDVFTMRQREWPDGTPIRVFILPDRSPIHLEFCREWLGTYPYVLRGVWNRLVFTGTGFEPVVVRSEDEMRERVKNTPGAIGYLSREAAGKGRVSVVPVKSRPSHD